MKKVRNIYAFVTLKIGIKNSEDLRVELLAHARKAIGPTATPDKLQFAEVLPKMRNGKTIKRILRKIAEESIEELEGTSSDSRTSEEWRWKKKHQMMRSWEEEFALNIRNPYSIILGTLGEGGKSG